MTARHCLGDLNVGLGLHLRLSTDSGRIYSNTQKQEGLFRKHCADNTPRLSCFSSALMKRADEISALAGRSSIQKFIRSNIYEVEGGRGKEEILQIGYWRSKIEGCGEVRKLFNDGLSALRLFTNVKGSVELSTPRNVAGVHISSCREGCFFGADNIIGTTGDYVTKVKMQCSSGALTEWKLPGNT